MNRYSVKTPAEKAGVIFLSFFGYDIFMSKRYKSPNKEIEGVETEHFEKFRTS